MRFSSVPYRTGCWVVDFDTTPADAPPHLSSEFSFGAVPAAGGVVSEAGAAVEADQLDPVTTCLLNDDGRPVRAAYGEPSTVGRPGNIERGRTVAELVDQMATIASVFISARSMNAVVLAPPRSLSHLSRKTDSPATSSCQATHSAHSESFV